jgi:hypothetical protein
MQRTSNRPQRRLSKRSLVKRLILTIGVVLSVVCVRTFFPALPAGAYPVLSTARWAKQNAGSMYVPHYRWLANGDLAYLETNARGVLQVCYQKMDARGRVGEIRYGPELPPGPSVNSFLPSPDERWVSYLQLLNAGQYQTVLVSADGKTTRTFPEILSAWLPDSRGFLFSPTGVAPCLKIEYLDAARTETIPGPYMRMPISISRLSNGPNFITGSSFFRPTALPGMLPSSPGVTLRSFSTSKPTVPLETWQPSLPPEASFGTAYPSPDGKQLLWTVWMLRTPSWMQWFHRWIPAWRSGGAGKNSYFLSDLRGAHMKPVLSFPVGGANSAPTWTPDSKHLSFIYKQQLYLLPVD